MTLELLCIEDKEEHKANAEQFFGSLGTKAPTIQYASTLQEATRLICKYDGQNDCFVKPSILTDIFFPTGSAEKGDREYRDDLAAELDNVRYDNRTPQNAPWVTDVSLPPPSGIYVVMHSVGRRMPALMVTDQSHHAKQCNPVTEWIRKFREGKDFQPGIVGNYQGTGSKDWEGAYTLLVARREGVEDYIHSITEAVSNLGDAKTKEEWQKSMRSFIRTPAYLVSQLRDQKNARMDRLADKFEGMRKLGERTQRVEMVYGIDLTKMARSC